MLIRDRFEMRWSGRYGRPDWNRYGSLAHRDRDILDVFKRERARRPDDRYEYEQFAAVFALQVDMGEDFVAAAGGGDDPLYWYLDNGGPRVLHKGGPGLCDWGPDLEAALKVATAEANAINAALRRLARGSLTPSLRFEVLKRDGHRCRYCGAGAELGPLQVDHVIPVAAGGKTEMSNLATACAICNAGKGSRPL